MTGQNKMKLISQFIICKGFVRLRSPGHRVVEQGDLDLGIFDMLSHICILPFPGHPKFTIFLFAVSPAAPDRVETSNTYLDAVDLHRGTVGQALRVLEQNRVSETLQKIMPPCILVL